MPRYHRLLKSLRQAFPAPVSDPVHDGYMAFTMLRALDQVDALKTQAPILGSPRGADFAEAGQARLAEKGATLEAVLPQLVACLEGMPIWGHPAAQVNVTAPPSIASVIGVVLPAMYNPNLCSEESGMGFSDAEVRVAAMIADLIGYDPAQSAGLFTFGGTGTLLYGVKIGLEKALPEAIRRGVREDAVVLASAHSHYACSSVAGWLGIGQENVIRAPTHADNAVDVTALENAAEEAVSAGRRIAAIIATMGTTDAFGVDDLKAIHALRERLVERHRLDYRPHLHADSVIGWAWSVFGGYDFDANPLEFRARTLRALAVAWNRMQHWKLADSLGVDFHKTGFAPYISSLLLVRDRKDFDRLLRARSAMPYLFHHGEYHPGFFSLETSRSATGVMAALANLLLLGKEGFRVLLGHAVEMAEILREEIAGRPELTVMNDRNHGPVTLFRAYPRDVDTFTVKDREMRDASYAARLQLHNEFNRRVFALVQAEALQGRGVALGFTDNYRPSDAGEPINAIKSYVLSPYASEARMATVVEQVLQARGKVEEEMGEALGRNAG
jgi:glutamate/tyrosine decarboxylase-like PLP-dependent enzyme